MTRPSSIGRLGTVAATALLAFAVPASACVPPDFDGSRTVDGADLGVLLSQWGPSGGLGPADLNHDGEVDGADLGLLLAAWGDVPAAACLSITSVEPSTGGQGTVVVLAGTFPDSNALNYLLTAVDAGGTVVPFDVLSVTPTSMTAVVGPAPAGMGSGTLGIALGAGNEVPIDALGAEFNLAGPIWVWSANEEGVVSSVDFEFQGAPSPSTYFGFLESGGPNLQVSSPCAEGATLDTWLVAQQGGPGSTEPFYAVALHIPAATLLRFQGPMTCANNLGDLIGDVLLAHAPDSISSQYSTQEGDPGFILGFSIDNLNADSGAFVVRVEGE